MTALEAVKVALNCETPEFTPLTVYDWFVTSDPEPWMPLIEQGLVVIENVQTVRHIEHGVERTYEERHEGGVRYCIQRLKTPVGTLQHVSQNGWAREYWVKSPGDYHVLQWVAENTELEACYRHMNLTTGEWNSVSSDTMKRQFGDNCIRVVLSTRTPLMTISVDFAGPERFSLDLLNEVPELYDLYEALKKLFVDETRLVATGPGRLVRWPENFTASMLGPAWFERLLVPVYRTCVSVLESSGKRVLVHYDGQLAAVADQIAEAPFHIIESLTEPPEGDMTYDRCREAWPDKAFWGHINLDTYGLPEADLRREVEAKRERAGKRGLVFEISEDLPASWRESVPIVMDTLRNLD